MLAGLLGAQQAVIAGGSQSMSGLRDALANRADAILGDMPGGQFLPQLSSVLPTKRRDVLSAMESRPDPMLNLHWYALMPSIQTASRGAVTLAWEYVEEATIPLSELEQVSNYRAGKNYHYPAHESISSLGLKFYEDINGHATNYVTAWSKLIRDQASGRYNVPAVFKKTIQIQILDVAGLSICVIDYIGCWPMRTSSIPLTSGTSERIVIDTEFSVDSINIKFGKFSETTMPSLMNSVGLSWPPDLSALI